MSTRALGAAFSIAASLVAGQTLADTSGYDRAVHAGRASVYQNLKEQSLERVSTAERILSVTQGNAAPTEIWRTLEHAERVECLSCIPYVERLLYSSHAKNREIAAWWLRRRVFGVFGPGEAYSRLVSAVTNDPSEAKRAFAAEGLGEFLHRAGVPLVARAAISDDSAMVRVAAVRALERLNTEGPAGELGTALADSSKEVRLAALRAATRINVFTAVDAVLLRLDDEAPEVRRRAAEVLGALRVRDAVVALVALSSPDQESDADVRAAAVSALGQIGDRSARSAVEDALADPDPIVESLARIALRRL